jgi:lipopolysaccharide transport system ATP-binding protein
MKKDLVISVEKITKQFHLYRRPYDRVKQALLGPLGRRYGHAFQALDDVTFEVRRGESVGIIGRNGAGKSTLLQLIVGTLHPTSGDLEVRGRVAALLELGAGFNPEFSGRENVYMTAKFMGFSRKEIEARFEEIAAFADIGEFMDQPVKTYSSGMLVRLGFAVQTSVDPDILIVDEALSVGDIFFQQKCLRRMRELRQKGVTLLFVSHDMGIVRDLCERAVYLRLGRMVICGSSHNAIGLFLQESTASTSSDHQEPGAPRPITSSDLIADFVKKAIWVRNEEDGLEDDRKAKILAVSVVNSQGFPTMKAQIGDEVKFEVLYQTLIEESVHVHLILKNRFDQIIFSNGSYNKGTLMSSLHKGECAIFEFELTCMIEAGPYTFSVVLGQTGETPNQGVNFDETPWIGPLTIVWDYEREKAPFLGMFGIPTTVRFINLSGADQIIREHRG